VVYVIYTDFQVKRGLFGRFDDFSKKTGKKALYLYLGFTLKEARIERFIKRRSSVFIFQL
jgi:hypothetical protein